VRFIHTSDWHLGHKLHNQSRHQEHEAFLNWLLNQCTTHDVDGLIIAGDLFDTPNPSAVATELFYQFVAQLHRQCPHLQTILIGGNHDSPQRLEAPSKLLEQFNVKVIGGLLPKHALHFERLYIPLHNKAGDVGAWVVAVPYLRPSDLPNHTPKPENYLIEGVRQVYQHALQGVEDLREPDQALIVTGHCYMNHGQLSLESERKILGNHQNALPLDLFPDQVSYVALGHLHLAQMLGGRDHIRYSGSPIPLSIAERKYQHQVLLVELEESRLKSIDTLVVPREVDFIRIPDHEGGLPLDEVLDAIHKLDPLDLTLPQWKRPFLSVCVKLDVPNLHIKSEIYTALEGKSPRLTRIQTIKPPLGPTLASALKSETLQDLKPDTVFALRWKRKHNIDVPDDVVCNFEELYNEMLDGENE
jgi:exonuclease SbcD